MLQKPVFLEVAHADYLVVLFFSLFYIIKRTMQKIQRPAEFAHTYSTLSIFTLSYFVVMIINDYPYLPL